MMMMMMATKHWTTLCGETHYEVDRRFGEGRGKPLDVESAGLIVVENLGRGLFVVDDDEEYCRSDRSYV
jgi:hypothetical protein